MGKLKYLLISLLILLAACEPELRAGPTSERVPVAQIEQNVSVDLCAAVTCPSGQKCEKGECECTEGKLCEDECIDDDACCTDDDCDSGACHDNECTDLKCKLGQEIYEGECECEDGMVYCPEQKKCIQQGKCCVHSQCPSFQRCVPTQYRASLCVKIAEKKFCRLLSDTGREEAFKVIDQDFVVKPINWLADHSIELNVNNQNVTIPENVTVTFNNSVLYQEGVEIVGGYCKEDEED